MKRPLEDDPDMNRLEELLRKQSSARREALMDLLEEEIAEEEVNHEESNRD